MQFTYPITIPPNTPKDSPTRQAIKLAYGSLEKIQIDFPWGCAGFAGVRILHYEHQVYPTNLVKWFVGNDITIAFEDVYPITQGWNAFKIEGYNEDDTYEHEPVVSFNILPFAFVPVDLAVWMEG